MTRKKRRLILLLLAMLGFGTAGALTLYALDDTLVFFQSPTDLQTKAMGDRRFRLGGVVEEGSVQRQPDGVSVAFIVTDFVNSIPVAYTGLLPDLFKEGRGVVAEGRLGPDGTFRATEVLAKHDENYMPPDVADALKRAGHVPGANAAMPPQKAQP